MSRDYLLSLKDILESCNKILRYVQEIDYTSFFDDEMRLDAVLRNLEIIGEAAKNVPINVRLKYPNIAWQDIAGLRDIIIHQYFGIDSEILWDIIQSHVPLLQEKLTFILKQEESQDTG